MLLFCILFKCAYIVPDLPIISLFAIITLLYNSVFDFQCIQNKMAEKLKVAPIKFKS